LPDGHKTHFLILLRFCRKRPNSTDEDQRDELDKQSAVHCRRGMNSKHLHIQAVFEIIKAVFHDIPVSANFK
jgi:hypothetical protein